MTDQITHIWTLTDLRRHRNEILAVAEMHGASNVRVFGSVAREQATAESDLDFLVSFRDGSSIFDQVGLWLDLKALLGCEVDLLADEPQAGRITDIARREAVPL